MNFINRLSVLLILAASLFATAACSDDHDPDAEGSEEVEEDADSDVGDRDSGANSDEDDADDEDGGDGGDSADGGVDADGGDDDDDNDEDELECGNGIVEEGQTCDDGIIDDNCDTYHDGGDGYCVPPDECSDGYVLDGDGECVDDHFDADIEIFVDNFCNLTVDPPEIDVPPGQTASFVYYNQSVDYEVDVWGSYGGGYLDLATGDHWDDGFVHCSSPDRPYTAGAEISIAGIDMGDVNCPGHNFVIYCQ